MGDATINLLWSMMLDWLHNFYYDIVLLILFVNMVFYRFGFSRKFLNTLLWAPWIGVSEGP